MIANRIKGLWKDGKPVLNGWLSIANAFTAEIMAAQGYDAITIDMQHGVVDYQAAVSMFQAMRASGVVPVARVPWLDPAHVMKALDAGAYGIICPMVNTPEEAARLVSYVRYPPHGSRSVGPTRANFSAGPNYTSEANDQIICLAMIETREAVEALEGIVATPGLDGVYIGPSDLTLGLFGGRLAPGFDRQEPEMIEAIKRVLATAHQAGKRAGLHNGTPDYAAKAVGWGFDLVTVSNDVRMLAGAAGASVARFRELADKSVSPQVTAARSY
jgi:4-hydroxy-2-oxoheptanedioate aldolase